jgi:hypothetical protein
VMPAGLEQTHRNALVHDGVFGEQQSQRRPRLR